MHTEACVAWQALQEATADEWETLLPRPPRSPATAGRGLRQVVRNCNGRQTTGGVPNQQPCRHARFHSALHAAMTQRQLARGLCAAV